MSHHSSKLTQCPRICTERAQRLVFKCQTFAPLPSPPRCLVSSPSRAPSLSKEDQGLKHASDQGEVPSQPSQARLPRMREGSICEHNRRRDSCTSCGGGSICEHGRQKSSCKSCGGSSFCEHGRIRSSCKSCGGASICEHSCRKSVCTSCGGSSICEHGRRRSRCSSCGGGSICKHGRQRSSCKSCSGPSVARAVLLRLITDLKRTVMSRVEAKSVGHLQWHDLRIPLCLRSLHHPLRRQRHR
jgi:hypothetical protein